MAQHVFTTRPPEGCSKRLYDVESGCELPWKEDGHTWRRIQTSYWFGDWIETQDRSMWRAYGGRHRAIYIVREDLMTLIRLKWL
jgi:hypothetical protein